MSHDAQKEQAAEIDGLSVFTAPMAARRAGRLKVRILQILSPMTGAAGSMLLSQIAGKGPRGFNTGDVNDLGHSVERLLRAVSGEQYDSLVLEILAGTHVELDGKRVWVGDPKGDKFDTVFTGRLATMYRVCAHALLVNYRDFFDMLSAWWAKVEAEGRAALEKMQAESTPAATSTTTS